jgi:hypothetical protein
MALNIPGKSIWMRGLKVNGRWYQIMDAITQDGSVRPDGRPHDHDDPLNHDLKRKKELQQRFHLFPSVYRPPHQLPE